MKILEVYVNFLLLCLVTPFKVDRKEKDLIDKEGYVTNCGDINAKDYSDRFCTCGNVWNGYTLMSKENKRHTCSTPSSVGCKIFFSMYRHPYVIQEKSGSVNIWSSLDKGCRTLKDVQIWNSKDAFGKWESFPMLIDKYFSIFYEKRAYKIKYSKLDMNIWSGHVIKLIFQCDKCTIMKVAGSSSYPFKREVFVKDMKLMKVERDEKDIIEKSGPISKCDTIRAKEYSESEDYCICNSPFQGYTLMSNENKTAMCMKPDKLRCNIYFNMFGHPHVIKKSKGKVRIWGGLGKGCNFVKELQFWNSNNNTVGNWETVSTCVYKYFIISGVDFTKLYYMNLDMNLWSGHVIKLVFGCDKCAIVKVAGIKKYPFGENFIRNISWTTAAPSTTTKSTPPPRVLKLYREHNDIVEKTASITDCGALKASVYSRKHCICDHAGGTIMSKNDTQYDCTTPKAIGCKVFFNDQENPYVIISDSDDVEVYNRLDKGCAALKDIQMWNTNNALGKWEQIKGAVNTYFKVSVKANKITVTYTGLDMKIWAGHVIRIKLNCDACAVMKVAGNTKYPFNVEEFMKKIKIHPKRSINNFDLTLTHSKRNAYKKSNNLTIIKQFNGDSRIP